MTLTSSTYERLIEAVREAAREVILPRFRNLDTAEIATKSGPDDLVTVADKEAEARITEAARACLPGALVIGEEAVSENEPLLATLGTAECAVVIDPVDGTWNFARGLTTFGVILAVTVRGETVFGLLYDPVCDDWIVAERGAGTRFCRPGQADRPIATQDGLSAARGCFLPLNMYAATTRGALMKALAGRARMLSLRCSCHEYRLLAQGHVRFSLSGSLKPWDHAAGALAVQEAGGVVAMLDGTPYRPAETGGVLLAAGDADTAREAAEMLRPCFRAYAGRLQDRNPN